LTSKSVPPVYVAVIEHVFEPFVFSIPCMLF